MTPLRKLCTIAAAAAGMAFGVTACSDSLMPSGPAQVTVLLTDAPIDYVGAAMVDIGAVELVPADEGAHVTLSDDGTDGPVNLLELQDAVTMVLADAEIESGEYAQLRLTVESASVTLADGYTFVDGSTEKDLTVPSGAQTGIKLILAGDGGEGPLVIPPGEMVLVVDFDVSQSFVIQGSPDTPAGIHGVSFKPTLRVVVLDAAGSISGDVTTALAATDVDSLVVTAAMVNGTALPPFQTDTVTTKTELDGTYLLPFLVPGEYTVRVTPPRPTLGTNPDSVRVVVGTGQDVTGVDFAVDSTGT